MILSQRTRSVVATGLSVVAVLACAPAPQADLLLTNASVYTLNWSEPAPNGSPATDAPHDSLGWHADATTIAVRGNEIVFVGSATNSERYRGTSTRVIDLVGAVVVPGFVDAHTHTAELGQSLERLDLTGIATPEAAIDKVAERAARTPKGEWIIGFGWDEGAWADNYPDQRALSARIPDHPVFLRGLHGFAGWANARALEQAGITRSTVAPTGGEIRRDARGEPTGLVLNRGIELLDKAVPAPTPAQRDSQVVRALRVMAASGFTGVHEAGTAADVVASLQRLADAGLLPVRVYALLDGRNAELLREWRARGPFTHTNGSLVIRAVKAYYDGALGSRGAQLLADYADRPGHRGVSGASYGFDRASVAQTMAAGFQVGIHAIGDAGNRESLDFIDSVVAAVPPSSPPRHRVEHAQVISPEDMPRFASGGIIASMQPPHAVEDKGWVEARLGAARTEGAYAWRTLRRGGAHLAFSSDLPGSSWELFYGLHSAITRQDTTGAPPEGFLPSQRMTAEEAVRGYTVWNAFAGFDEVRGGTIAVGKRADFTVIDVDPFRVGSARELLRGKVLMTVFNGRVTYEPVR